MRRVSVWTYRAYSVNNKYKTHWFQTFRTLCTSFTIIQIIRRHSILWRVRLRSRRCLVTARQAAEEEGVTRKRPATKQCQGSVSYGVGSQAIYREPCSSRRCSRMELAERVTSEYSGRAAVFREELQLRQWIVKCITYTVIVCDPINPVVNPIPVLYSRHIRATICSKLLGFWTLSIVRHSNN
jgi:hypothetical protein